MADRISINFTADVREVVRGTDQIGQELDKTGKGLEAVAGDGEKTFDTITKGQKEVTAGAKDMGDGVTGSGGAFTELASKADGALGGVGGGLLEVAGIAGGVGGVVASAVGGAFTFVSDIINTQIDAANKLKDSLVSSYRTAAEEGRNYLAQAQITAKANDIIFGDTTALDAYKSKAQAIGVDVNTYVLAQAGSYEDLKVVIEAATAAAEIGGKVTEDKSRAGQVAAVQEKQLLDGIVAANQTLLEIHDRSKGAAENAQSIKDQLAQRERDQIQRTQDADQARWEALKTQYDKASALAPVVVPAEIATPNVNQMLSSLQLAANARRIRVTADLVTRDGRLIE